MIIRRVFFDTTMILDAQFMRNEENYLLACDLLSPYRQILEPFLLKTHTAYRQES